MSGVCSIDGCGRVVKTRGWCAMHYHRVQRHGDPLGGGTFRGSGISLRKPCIIDGCERLVHGGNYCGIHYARFLRCGNPLGGKRFRGEPPRACKAPGCSSIELARGFCNKHYQRHMSGRPLEDTSNIGKKYTRAQRGYVQIVVPPGTPGSNKAAGAAKFFIMPEHRFVMQNYLGRPLYPDETVHHINGDRADNRLINLELWSKAQPSGQRIEDKLQHAIEMILRYGSYEQKRAIRPAWRQPKLRMVA